MGCLNSNQNFSHWFGNIHFSGPCNRSCYFCIGQHMMALDPLDTLTAWPLPGLDAFVEACTRRDVTEVNLTGSNTDPMMYRHITRLAEFLRSRIEGLVLGIRTNGTRVEWRAEEWRQFDKASISITSFDPAIYRNTMGNGKPPNVARILAMAGPRDIKANVVLCPEILGDDLGRTLTELERLGVRRINLREPYGQPHIGDPLRGIAVRDGGVLGMPSYKWGRARVTYWDVHYCEVESVNLYANGRVSEDYPITRGHDERGTVLDQSHFTQSGRVRPQWVTVQGAYR